MAIFNSYVKLPEGKLFETNQWTDPPLSISQVSKCLLSLLLSVPENGFV